MGKKPNGKCQLGMKFIVAMAASNLFVVWGCALLLWGCQKNESGAAVAAIENGLTKIRVGYIGLTCEAPIYMRLQGGRIGSRFGQVRLVQLQEGRNGAGWL